MLRARRDVVSGHPSGEGAGGPPSGHSDPVLVPTAGGLFRVRWDESAKVSALGGFAFFAQFLDATNLFNAWVAGCPLERGSNRAHRTRDVLGTALLSILNGHTRYAHVTALRGDVVNASLLGMTRIVSEDTVRRSLKRMEHEAARSWQQEHLIRTIAPLLTQPWVLDVDVTVKPLYGNQEGAKLGYNPAKPSRPSHAYHTYLMGSTRLVLDVEVLPGDEHTAASPRPGLWHFLEKLPSQCWPALLRGDCSFGSEAMMSWPEMRNLPYLFKLRKSQGVQRLIAELDASNDGWVDAGQGWQGQESHLRLMGWTRARRVVILRRPASQSRLRVRRRRRDPHQQRLSLELTELERPAFDFQVLVTTLSDDIPTLAARYRDRADAENVFDELKNQWGWAGFTTKSIDRCQVAARMIAQIYNWWSLFVGMADPHRHHEAITTRPLLLHGVARQTDSAGQRLLTITHTHAKASSVQRFFTSLSAFLRGLTDRAEHWTSSDRWSTLLQQVFAAAFGRLAPSG